MSRHTFDRLSYAAAAAAIQRMVAEALADPLLGDAGDDPDLLTALTPEEALLWREVNRDPVDAFAGLRDVFAV